jgi:hypothetical protein
MDTAPGPVPGGSPRFRSIRRNLAFTAVAMGLVFLVLEGLASVHQAALQIPPIPVAAHIRYDTELGWANTPNLRIASHYAPGVLFTTNAQGFRGAEDVTSEIPRDRFRVICLGDSFTMGYGVGDADSYPAQLQASCPRVQAVNMGQGGYGIDQAYLWYKRDGVKLKADLLIFAFIAHDFYRMSQRSFDGYPKPMLRAKDGALSVENVPVPRRSFLVPYRRPAIDFVRGLSLFRSMAWLMRRGGSGTTAAEPARPFYSAAHDDTLNAAGLIFQDLAQISQERGQQLVLVYLPSNIVDEPTRESEWLRDWTEQHGVRAVNLVEDFGRLPPWELPRMFNPQDGHYSARGNHFVATALLKRLQAQNPSLADCSH